MHPHRNAGAEPAPRQAAAPPPADNVHGLGVVDALRIDLQSAQLPWLAAEIDTLRYCLEDELAHRRARYPRRLARERAQQRELLLGQLDVFAVDAHLAAGRVDRQRPDAQPPGGRPVVGAVQQHPDPGAQLGVRDVWGYRADGRTRTLDSHACRARHKLAAQGCRFVINVWGVGYRLVDGDPRAREASAA